MINVVIFNLSNFKDINTPHLKKLSNALTSKNYTLYAVDSTTIKELNKRLRDLNINLNTHTSGHIFSLTEHYSEIIKLCIDQNIGIDNIIIVDYDYKHIKIAEKLRFNICLCDLNTIQDDDVILNKILHSINYYTSENNSIGKKTCFQKSINIVVPIMGDNRRFINSRYGIERNLIEMMGKDVLFWVLSNLQIDANYIFIIREHLCRLHKFDKILKSMYPNCTIIKSETKTQGNACSILLAENYINNNNPLIVCNDNQWLSWNVQDYITDFLLNQNAILQAITFRCCGDNRFHYIKTSEDDKTIKSIHLNTPINEYALTDIYFWKHGSDYVKYTHRMNSQNKRLFGEFCTTLITNEVLDDINNNILPKESVIHRICDKYFTFQEEQHIQEFEQWYTENQLPNI